MTESHAPSLFRVGGERAVVTIEQKQPQVHSTARRESAMNAGKICDGAPLRMTFVY
jgi:hypothetical protein